MANEWMMLMRQAVVIDPEWQSTVANTKREAGKQAKTLNAGGKAQFSEIAFLMIGSVCIYPLNSRFQLNIMILSIHR